MRILEIIGNLSKFPSPEILQFFAQLPFEHVGDVLANDWEELESVI